MTVRVGIINVTGFAGIEAARLLWNHPEAELVAATGRSLAGQRLGEAFPSLAVYRDLVIDDDINVEVDIVMSALPTAASAEACAPYVRQGIPVIDIAADFRLRDEAAYREWYGADHPAPDILQQAVYGLPELNREALRSAKLVANPGCPATSLLALAPAFADGLIEDTIIVDAKSGISGAGRGGGGGFSYADVNEDVSAYKVAAHNHQPEIAQELGCLREGPQPKVTFVPHLVPMTRGIATCSRRWWRCRARPGPGPLPRLLWRRAVHERRLGAAAAYQAHARQQHGPCPSRRRPAKRHARRHRRAR
ncbi:MAG: N-acetyl-gamma-glutamyl-phosphate reductase [Dehalococcoidia bacterium]|nr:N-acetyl-gamma-glutamyl-phosphate reductase [Dehalococcoidia bacterium]